MLILNYNADDDFWHVDLKNVFMTFMTAGQCESMSIRRTVNAEMRFVIFVLHDFF